MYVYIYTYIHIYIYIITAWTRPFKNFYFWGVGYKNLLGLLALPVTPPPPSYFSTIQELVVIIAYI